MACSGSRCYSVAAEDSLCCRRGKFSLDGFTRRSQLGRSSFALPAVLHISRAPRTAATHAFLRYAVLAAATTAVRFWFSRAHLVLHTPRLHAAFCLHAPPARTALRFYYYVLDHRFLPAGTVYFALHFICKLPAHTAFTVTTTFTFGY